MKATNPKFIEAMSKHTEEVMDRIAEIMVIVSDGMYAKDDMRARADEALEEADGHYYCIDFCDLIMTSIEQDW